MPCAILSRSTVCSLVLILVSFTTSGCGSGKGDPEQIVIGQWERDKEETQKSNPTGAAWPDPGWYEFKADGSCLSGVAGSPYPGKWKTVKKEGTKLILEETPKDIPPRNIEIVVIDKDHITINHGQLGPVHFKRATRDVTKTGAPAGQTLKPRLTLDTGAKTAGGLALSADGKIAAVSTNAKSKNVQIWDLTRKEKIQELGDESVLDAVALTPDGKVVAYPNQSGLISLTEVATAKRLHQVSFGFTYDLRFSPSGDLLVVGVQDAIRGWNTKTGEQKLQWTEAGTVTCLSAFFEDGKKIASNGKQPGDPLGVKDKAVYIWDISSGKPQKFAAGGEYNVSELAVSPDGKRLATRSRTGPINIWELSTGKTIKTIEDQRLGFGDVFLFLPDGKSLIYAADHDVLVENIETGNRLVLPGHEAYVRPHGLALSSDGKVLVSCSNGSGSFMVWDIQSP